MSRNGSGGRAALVTGTSSGIGAELADVIAADGYDVALNARREERLREVADGIEADHGVEATVLPQDLAELDAADALAAAVDDAGLDVDVLVNNAGVPHYGSFVETDRGAERDMMQVNMVTLTELTKLFASRMAENGGEGVLNTASLAGLYPIPKKAVYAASKSYVINFSRALAHELEDEGLTVTALCPGVVETAYATRGNVEKSNTMEGISNDPRTVAESGWAGFKNGDRLVFPSTFATYGAQVKRFLPRKFVTELGESTVEEGQSWI